MHTNIFTDLVNKTNLVHILFSVHLSISTCFKRLCAHHQEKHLCFCDTWYLLFCVYECLVCRVEFHPATGFYWAIRQRVPVIPYTCVSGQPMGPIFKLQEEGLLTLEEENDRLSRYVGIRNYHYSLRNSPEGRSSLLFFYDLTCLFCSCHCLNTPGPKKHYFLNRRSHVREAQTSQVV